MRGDYVLLKASHLFVIDVYDSLFLCKIIRTLFIKLLFDQFESNLKQSNVI